MSTVVQWRSTNLMIDFDFSEKKNDFQNPTSTPAASFPVIFFLNMFPVTVHRNYYLKFLSFVNLIFLTL